MMVYSFWAMSVCRCVCVLYLEISAFHAHLYICIIYLNCGQWANGYTAFLLRSKHSEAKDTTD